MIHSLTIETRPSGSGPYSFAAWYSCTCGDAGILAHGATPAEARTNAQPEAAAHRAERTGMDMIRGLGR